MSTNGRSLALVGPSGLPIATNGTLTYTQKADIGDSDASLLVGTIADSNMQRMPDCQQYWILYKKHPWVRACVKMIANAVAQEGFAVALVDGESHRAITNDDDPRVGDIFTFFRHAFVGRIKTFRQAMKALTTDLEVFGVAYWRRKRAGRVLVGLERLDPRLVTPVLSKDKTKIDSYAIAKNQLSNMGVVVEQSGTEEIPTDEVILFTAEEGGDAILGGPALLEALDITLAMDMNIRQHRNSFFQNGAAVGNVLINKEGVEEQVEAAVKQLRSQKTGSKRAYSNLVLTGDWIVQSLMQSGKNEVDFVKGTEAVRTEVCSIYGVPESKFMQAKGGLGSSGKGEDDETFEQDCILPLEELVYETITREIMQGDFDIEDLAMIPKRRNALRYERIDAAMNIVKCGGSGNEARTMIGLPPIEDPKYDMDAPLFITVRGKTVGEDEPLAIQQDANQEQGPQPSDSKNSDTGSVTDNSDEPEEDGKKPTTGKQKPSTNKKGDEVPASEEKRFRRPRFTY